MNLVCNNLFEGGSWLQVRYKSSASQWHLAKDGLRGLDVYGYPGLSEYSIQFSHLMTPESELLFVLGTTLPQLPCYSISRKHVLTLRTSCLIVGDNFNYWAITTWNQINNFGTIFAEQARAFRKSSTSSTSCAYHVP